ncbi:uroplakin-3b-like [Pyxicephalus adspersus]|uniref:uroplakin-3b-like n=1 Tax=Pyxicephalus adspersus TaxID=30357 RepID=UPI003B5C9EF0
MDLYFKLGLFLALCAAASTDEVTDYIPKLTSKDVTQYNATESMFILEQPHGIFNKYPTNIVWLVVAKSKAVPTITDLSTPVSCNTFKANNLPYYHILPLPADQYPQSNNTINILLVGSETNCSEKDACNCPLNNTLNYRVKFVLLSSAGLFKETQWSQEITLLTRSHFQEDPQPKGRSGGMIALTSILSVLLAILLISLIAALAVGSRDICWKETLIYNVDARNPEENFARGTYRSHYAGFFNSLSHGRRPLYED